MLGPEATLILFFASDLVWATRIKRTAEGLGIACRPVRDNQKLSLRMDEFEVRGLIIDLETEQGGIDMVQAARAHPSGNDVRIICFGPHVREDLLAQASQVGADRVLVRGAFDRRLVEILHELDGSEAPSPD